jgi:hypothetical protein
MEGCDEGFKENSNLEHPSSLLRLSEMRKFIAGRLKKGLLAI